MSFRSAERLSNQAMRQQADTQRIHHMNAQLLRINNRIERKLNEYRAEAEASGHLLARASRLSERLNVLKHKLRLCFDLCGEQQPANLQIILKQMADVDPEHAPPDFVCPITQCIMVDPVRTSDGSAYDRAAIAEWFYCFEAKGQMPTSPLTNLPLNDRNLIPDVTLRQQIQQFLKTFDEVHQPNKDSNGRRVSEPSIRDVPEEVLAIEARSQAVPLAASSSMRTHGAPIWSSSVVPHHEENSRVLNLLRVSDINVSEMGSLEPLATTSSGVVGRALLPHRTSRLSTTRPAPPPFRRPSAQAAASRAPLVPTRGPVHHMNLNVRRSSSSGHP